MYGPYERCGRCGSATGGLCLVAIKTTSRTVCCPFLFSPTSVSLRCRLMTMIARPRGEVLLSIKRCSVNFMRSPHMEITYKQAAPSLLHNTCSQPEDPLKLGLKRETARRLAKKPVVALSAAVDEFTKGVAHDDDADRDNGPSEGLSAALSCLTRMIDENPLCCNAFARYALPIYMRFLTVYTHPTSDQRYSLQHQLHHHKLFLSGLVSACYYIYVMYVFKVSTYV
jgi:hypothetical protein